MTIEKQRAQLRFVFDGFKQEAGFRLFAFQRVESDNSRTSFSVRVELGLIRLYGIHVQDLPLLCRDLLERRADSEVAREMTFTEEAMRQYHADRMVEREAAQRRKAPRVPPAENTRSAWRTAFQFSPGNRA